jgi:hypothetical protein
VVAGSANSSTSDPIDSVLSIAGSYSICFCYTYAHTTRSAPSTVCTVCTRCSTYAREESSIFIIPELGAADLAAVATIASGSSFSWITAELAHFFCLQSKVELLARKFVPNLIGKNPVIILIMIMLHCLFSNPILIGLFVIAFLLEEHSIQSVRRLKSSRHDASNEPIYSSTAPTLHEVIGDCHEQLTESNTYWRGFIATGTWMPISHSRRSC